MNPILPPRRVLPRWRSFQLSRNDDSISGLANVETAKVNFDDIRITAIEKLEEWRDEPLPGLAADIISYSVFPELHPLIKDVATEVLRTPNIFPLMIVNGAKKILGDAPASQELVVSDPRIQITNLRKRLRDSPGNPIALMDYALFQLSMGKVRAAKRAVISATTLAPGHRLILRNAARFYVHVDDAGRALKLLADAPSLRSDPWLLAAEISVNSVMGHTSTHLKRVHDWLERIAIPTVHFSELASAVATEHIIAGKYKHAKRNFEQALQSPTENAVAQVQWAALSEQKIPFIARNEWLTRPEFHELQCIRAYSDGNFERVITSADEWCSNEPFSSRPRVMSSFARGVLGQFQDAEKEARIGLIASPDDPLLLNNLYYFLASQGKSVEAQEYLMRVLKEESQNPTGHTLANVGLYYLQHGDSDNAAKYYRGSRDWFVKRHNFGGAASALACYARELHMHGDLRWQEISREIDALPNQKELVTAHTIIKSFTDMEAVGKPRAVEIEASTKNHWLYDITKNIITLKR